MKHVLTAGRLLEFVTTSPEFMTAVNVRTIISHCQSEETRRQRIRFAIVPFHLLIEKKRLMVAILLCIEWTAIRAINSDTFGTFAPEGGNGSSASSGHI